jgi:hypothetical protein
MTDSNPNVIRGAKHDSRRDLRDTARLIRADIRAATKAGELPAGFQARVKISRYSMGQSSMGQSITITIVACPGVQLMNPERVAAEAAAPFAHTDAAREVLARVEGIAAAYNYRRTDCKHHHFYASIDFDSALTEETDGPIYP